MFFAGYAFRLRCFAVFLCDVVHAKKRTREAAWHSEQRESWLEAELDLDPARLVKGSARRKLVQSSSDDFST
jgi:hypothetical protein